MLNKYRQAVLLLLLLLLLLLWLGVTECPQVGLRADEETSGSTSRCLVLNFPGNFSSIFSDALQGSFKSWVNVCSSRTSVVITLIHSNPVFWQHVITLSSGSCDVPSWMDSTLFFQHLMGKQDPSKYLSPVWFCRLILQRFLPLWKSPPYSHNFFMSSYHILLNRCVVIILLLLYSLSLLFFTIRALLIPLKLHF